MTEFDFTTYDTDSETEKFCNVIFEHGKDQSKDVFFTLVFHPSVSDKTIYSVIDGTKSYQSSTGIDRYNVVLMGGAESIDHQIDVEVYESLDALSKSHYSIFIQDDITAFGPWEKDLLNVLSDADKPIIVTPSLSHPESVMDKSPIHSYYETIWESDIKEIYNIVSWYNRSSEIDVSDSTVEIGQVPVFATMSNNVPDGDQTYAKVVTSTVVINHQLESNQDTSSLSWDE